MLVIDFTELEKCYVISAYTHRVKPKNIKTSFKNLESLVLVQYCLIFANDCFLLYPQLVLNHFKKKEELLEFVSAHIGVYESNTCSGCILALYSTIFSRTIEK